MTYIQNNSSKIMIISFWASALKSAAANSILKKSLEMSLYSNVYNLS